MREPLGFNRAAAELLAERLLRAGEDGVLVAPNVLLDAYSRAKVRRGPHAARQPRTLVSSCRVGYRVIGVTTRTLAYPAVARGYPRSLAPPSSKQTNVHVHDLGSSPAHVMLGVPRVACAPGQGHGHPGVSPLLRTPAARQALPEQASWCPAVRCAGQCA